MRGAPLSGGLVDRRGAMTAYSTSSSEVEGLETIELSAPGPDGLTGGVRPRSEPGAPLAHEGGRELLAINDGLRAYQRARGDDGHPPAVSLGQPAQRIRYAVDGTEVSLPRDVPLFARDHNGLPIHGALPGLMEWDVVARAPMKTAPACGLGSSGTRRTRRSGCSPSPTGSSTRLC